MKNLTTKHGKVALYNKSNGESLFNNRGQVNSLKKHYMVKIEELLESKGMYLDELSKAQQDILGLLVYNTAPTGIQTIGVSKLMEKTGYSRSTVLRAKKAISELGIFTVAYLGNEHKGKYVFILDVHKNFESIMLHFFGIDVKKANETSCDTSNDTSSISEIPCESKAEEPKTVSTLSTLKPLNTRDLINNMSHEQANMVSKIKEAKRVKAIYVDNAEVIVSMLPKKYNDVQIEAIDRMIKNQFTRVAPEYDKAVKSYVVTMFNEEVKLIENRNAVQANLENNKRVPFYDWLNAPSTSPAPSKEVNKGYSGLFYNWLEEDGSEIIEKPKQEAPVYPEWQLEGFNSKEEYLEALRNNTDMPY